MIYSHNMYIKYQKCVSILIDSLKVMNNKTSYNIPLKSIPFYVININQYNTIYNNESYIIDII